MIYGSETRFQDTLVINLKYVSIAHKDLRYDEFIEEINDDTLGRLFQCMDILNPDLFGLFTCKFGEYTNNYIDKLDEDVPDKNYINWFLRNFSHDKKFLNIMRKTFEKWTNQINSDVNYKNYLYYEDIEFYVLDRNTNNYYYNKNNRIHKTEYPEKKNEFYIRLKDTVNNKMKEFSDEIGYDKNLIFIIIPVFVSVMKNYPMYVIYPEK